MQDPLASVAPRQANWDLRRDVAKKLEKLIESSKTTDTVRQETFTIYREFQRISKAVIPSLRDWSMEYAASQDLVTRPSRIAEITCPPAIP